VIWSELSVDENLKTIGKLKGLGEDEIETRLDQLKRTLNMQRYSSKAAKKLSGGNKRKLCSAMALMRPPRIILMDEASNGVDPISRKNLYSYLKQLRNTSSLLITHRIDEAEKICDRIAIMADGKFLDLDSPSQLKERHGIVYILQLEPSSTSQLSLKNINTRIT
jgi:ABC-2 type transport system ATP-binding protein